ncbi:MAG: hypothetical protein RMM53_09820 [Bacteroidia bacterium]|nr:hypothetical protein [Bacteroidia bacterium]MDW8334499.1 hypothetical protein [Bacteroidia bacterium]
MSTKIEDIKYRLSFTDLSGNRRVEDVTALRILQWKKIPHERHGDYFSLMYPNAVVLGDNADGFDSGAWPRRMKDYETPVHSSMLELCVAEEVGADGNKKVVFIQRSPKYAPVLAPSAVPFPLAPSSDKAAGQTSKAGKAKARKDAADAEKNSEK